MCIVHYNVFSLYGGQGNEQMAVCPLFYFFFLSAWCQIFYLTRPAGRFRSHSSALRTYQKPAIQPGVISSPLTGGPEFETAGVLQLGAEWCWQSCLKKFA